jgi:hypothetical protein
MSGEGASVRASAARRASPPDKDAGSSSPERPSSFSRYYVQATLVCAWCELRNDIRHFRTDPIVATAVLDEPFKIPDAVIAAWAAERDDQ